MSTSFRRSRFALLGVLALLAALTAGPDRAAAHANLLDSDPPPQSILARAPGSVRLFFTETVEPSSVEVSVTDGRRNRVDQGDGRLVAGQDKTVEVTLAASLPPGVYTVNWKVVSTVDGHLTRGLIPFTVGDPGAIPESGAVGETSTASSGGVTGVVARWLMVLASVALTGGFIFAPLMLRPAVRLLAATSGPDQDDSAAVTPEQAHSVATGACSRLLRLSWLLLALLTVSAVALLLVEVATTAGTSIAGALNPARFADLPDLRRGLWIARCVLLLLITALLAWTTRRSLGDARAFDRVPAWLMLAVLSAATLAVQSRGSHSAGLRSGAALAAAIDFLHLLAVSVWFGGLVMFGLALLPALAPLGGPSRTGLLAGLLPRFSLLAGGSVAVLTLTGIYQTWRLLGGWAALIEDGWGRALLVKLALLLPLLGLAAFNLLVVSRSLRRLAPRMDRPAREVAARIRARFRRALLGEIGLAAGVLLAVGVLIGQAPERATGFTPAGPFRPLIDSLTVEDITGRFVLAPARIGLNRFDFTFTQNGQPLPSGTDVVLRISTLDRDTGMSEVTTQALGGGRFTTSGSYLSTIGLWEVAALVRRPGRDEVRLPFKVSLTEDTGQAIVRDNRPAASIDEARRIYADNCAQCHGATGRGDGPLAPALNPRPVDLTVHVPLHSDRVLFDWIADGIPRTAMPAWKGQLTDEQIQGLINFLRQTAEQSGQER